MIREQDHANVKNNSRSCNPNRQKHTCQPESHTYEPYNTGIIRRLMSKTFRHRFEAEISRVKGTFDFTGSAGLAIVKNIEKTGYCIRRANALQSL